MGKLWNDRESFDPEKILGTLSRGRREWPDLERLIGRARRRNWNRESAAAATRFGFLREMTPFELARVADSRRHALRAELMQHLARLG